MTEAAGDRPFGSTNAPPPARPPFATPPPSSVPPPSFGMTPVGSAGPPRPNMAPPQPAPIPADILDSEALIALPQGGTKLIGTGLDLLVGARVPLRQASLYIGLVFLLTVGPLALLVLGGIAGGTGIDDAFSGTVLRGELGARADRYAAALTVAGLIAMCGFVVTSVESQAIATAVLASQLTGQPLSLRAGLMRSRVVFWRLVRGGLIVGIPLTMLSVAVELMLGYDRSRAEGVQLVGVVVQTLVGAPFAYLATAIVVGDVGALEAVRRSVSMARTRPGTALAVSVFAAMAQYLLTFGLGAGADILARLAVPFHVDLTSGPLVVLLIAAGIGLFLLALGSLQFTVVAIATVPQVVAFLALTRYVGGLHKAHAAAQGPGAPAGSMSSRIGPDGRVFYWDSAPTPRRFRWLTLPLLVGVTVGLGALAAGLAQVIAV
jgi:hypothetical protein